MFYNNDYTETHLKWTSMEPSTKSGIKWFLVYRGLCYRKIDCLTTPQHKNKSAIGCQTIGIYIKSKSYYKKSIMKPWNVFVFERIKCFV